MDIAAKAHDLMAAAGPALNFVAVDEYSAEGVWHIAPDERSEMFAEIDRDRRVLVLSAEVGVPGAKDRGRLYDLLLHYNNCWELTQGMRLGIDAPGGAVRLLADFPVDGIDRTEFFERLRNFVEKTAGWRDIVARFDTGESGKNDALAASMQNIIRG